MNFIQGIKNRLNSFLHKNKKFKTEEEFYTYLFTKNPSWNSKEPNEDENIRLVEIAGVIDKLNIAGDIDILEIGSGRGWLTNRLSKYGRAIGIEPVEPVVKYAKKLFPEHNFFAEFPSSFIQKFPEKKFNLIVSTEVLEHVVEKEEFMKQIQSLLKPNGIVIITTPRLEQYDDFVSVYGVEPGQPVEEWMSEEQVKELILNSNFDIVDKIIFDPLPIKDKTVYSTQLWVFKKK